MNTNIVLCAALCCAVKGMDCWWKNSFLFYIRFNLALANKEVHCVLIQTKVQTQMPRRQSNMTLISSSEIAWFKNCHRKLT